MLLTLHCEVGIVSILLEDWFGMKNAINGVFVFHRPIFQLFHTKPLSIKYKYEIYENFTDSKTTFAVNYNCVTRSGRYGG